MWKDYFYHTKSERFGLVLLLTLILLVTGLGWALSAVQMQNTFDSTNFQEEVALFETDIALIEQEIAEKRQKRYPKYKKRSKTNKTDSKQQADENKLAITEIDYFDFDPNKVTKEELLNLGLSSRTAQSILNYRKKGGEFRSKSDLSKIYTLDASDYNRLEPYISLPDTIERRRTAFSKDPASYPKAKALVLDINLASAEEFEKLRGIGPAFAKRILKYRKALGGFITIEQLGEVYGLPDSTFMSIRSQLRCHAKIQKINLNTASAEELKSHPYLRWKHANAIVRYRQDNGPYTDPEILRTFFEFDDGNGTYWKIKPYLTL